MKGHIEKRENGNFRAKVYVPSTGKYLSKTFKTKREAQAWCNTTLADMQRGRFAEATSLLLSHWADEWLTYHVSQRVKPKTLGEYKRHVSSFISFVGQKALLRDITGRHVVAWMSSLRNELSGNTISLGATVVGSMFSDAENMDLIGRNPFKGIKKPRQKSDVSTFWSLDEVQTFLKTAESHRMYPLFATALFTGMRQGELLGLMWEDVDLKSRTITIKRTYTAKVYGTPKTDTSARTVTIPYFLCQILQQHRRNQIAHIGSSVVFASPTGKPISQFAIMENLDKLAAIAGVRRIRFHDMRHTHASLLFEQDTPAKVIQERLGHASIRVTLDIYTHLTKQKHESVASRLDDLMAHSQDIPKQHSNDA